MQEPKMILGISPGTRYVGISLFQNGRLIGWKVKTFKGKTTKKKLQHIRDSVRPIIEGYAVDAVTLKIPDCKRTSKNVRQIISDIEKIVVEKKLQFFRCNITALKQMCSVDNRKNLVEYLMQKYPKELSSVENCGPNRHPYYEKMFEAVAAGMLHSPKSELRTPAISPSYTI
jgi:hypothetical protein